MLNLKKLIIKYWTILTLTIVIFTFFSRLFFPEPSIFTTPDFGRTDILHIAIPQKLAESEGLKKFTLPFWEFNAGSGYPVLAESMGFFFIPNLLTLYLLPFTWAIPSLFLITFLIGACSMYYLLRTLKLDLISSSIGSLAFVFSAAMVLRVQHIAIEQALAIVPLAFAFLIKLLETKDLKNAIILSIVLSQILVTFPQIFLYTAILLLFFFLVYVFSSGNLNKKKITYLFIFSLFFSITISSIQFLPTYELLKQSTRSNGVNLSITSNDFPLQFKNLATFIHPFILGKASNGTYNSPQWNQYGLFWENTSYVGFLPFILSIGAIIYLLIKKPKNAFTIFALIAPITILLALGKSSPLYVLFSFPPLNFFRVPARFILFTQMLLAILAAYGGTILKKKLGKGILILILFITILDFFIIWYKYNPTEEVKNIFAKPEILENINPQDLKNFRTLTIRSNKIWNEIFQKYGWENKYDYYKFFRNSAEPNSNLFYSVNSFSAYQILPTRRQNLINSLLQGNVQMAKDEMQFEETAMKILDAYSIKFIITTIPIKNEGFYLKNETKKGNYNFYLYQRENVPAVFQVYYDYKEIKTIGEYSNEFGNQDTRNTVLLENFNNKKFQKGVYRIEEFHLFNNRAKLKFNSTEDGVLVFSDSYYPGWKAKVDNQEARIFAANINSKALVIPRGEHTVEFSYTPKYFLLGVVITTISLLFAIKILISKS